MKTHKLSPSSLKLFEECPRCFWLTKHNVWKRPSGIFPSLPNGMDRIIKEYFDNYREKGKLPPEVSTLLGEYQPYAETVLLTQWRNNFIGIRHEDSNGHILFGAVDEIVMKDGKLIVLDYKSRGYPLKENTINFYKTQLEIYTYLLKKNGYEVEDYAYLLFYIPKKVGKSGQIAFQTELVKVDVDVKNAEKLFSNALDVLGRDCPEKGCGWCEGR